MNAGLANFHTLKEQILPAALEADTQFDAQLLSIGTGVAAAFERFCNRLFARVVGAQDELPASNAWWPVRRAPVEAITKVEIRDDLVTGWQDYGLDAVRNYAPASGIVDFYQETGIESARLRLTYTGGWWWDVLEPADVGYPAAMPAGATAVPADVRLAWITQSFAEFQRRDMLGKAALQNKPVSVGDMVILPSVVSVLNSYRRMAS